MADGPTRSWLFTPATRPDRFDRAAAVGADILILDLEDAVAPADKPGARNTALAYLSDRGDTRVGLALRMNGLDTRAGIADLDALLTSEANPEYLLLPKTEDVGHMLILDRQLTAAGRQTRLVALIESAAGLAKVDAIAASTPRMHGLMLGAADMAADLGATAAWTPLTYARSRIVHACALATILPIDSPFFDVGDADGLIHETLDAIALGFAAKAAIHPNQVGPINVALTPDDAAVAHARAVIETSGKGVGTLDGQMIDEAVARKARRVLAARTH